MGRPVITGTVVRRIDLHCEVGGSNKDYRITLTEADEPGSSSDRYRKLLRMLI